LKKVFLASGFSNKNGTQQMLYMYDVLTESMLISALMLSHYLHKIPCFSSIHIIRRLFLNP